MIKKLFSKSPRVADNSKTYKLIENNVSSYEIPSIGDTFINDLVFKAFANPFFDQANPELSLQTESKSFKIEDLAFLYSKTASIPNLDLHNAIDLKNRWFNRRRGEILELFKKFVYGRMPERPKITPFIIKEQGEWFNNKGFWRKQIRISLDGQKNDLDDDFKLETSKSKKRQPQSKSAGGVENTLLEQLIQRPHFIDVLIVLPDHPDNINKSIPAFVGLNFFGNHTISNDPNILVPRSYSKNNRSFKIKNNVPTEKSRGCRKNRWPIEMILNSGYAFVGAYYGDITPDFNDGLSYGINKRYSEYALGSKLDDKGEAWGAIGAWAWGLSRILDYLEIDESINSHKVYVIGHSRLGKTALWASATDERFAGCISNDSGCGGAALFRRRVGETVKKINKGFPHWFCKNFRKFDDREHELPIDQHMLIALTVDRPVYVASANYDIWADPVGEFLSLKYASILYNLLGKKDIPEEVWAWKYPHLQEPLVGNVGYHLRKGRHDLTRYDWKQFLKFASLNL